MTYAAQRQQMVTEQLEARGISDARVLEAMRRVPRERFVPPPMRAKAYADGALPIGNNQTISQPFVVALMTQLLRLQGTETVLEIGTGSGYQAAILCELAAQVHSLERHPALSQSAAAVLGEYANITLHVGDGTHGLRQFAPYHAIIVTAAAPSLPGPLRTQLHPNGGRMVVPVGNSKSQRIQRLTRQGDRWRIEKSIAVRFVPLIGRYGFQQKQ